MIKIITDSSANISQAEAMDMGITVIPLTIIFGDKEYRDGVDMFEDEFYTRLVESGEFPHTAQVTEEQLTKAYTEACADGSEVLVLLISKALSGSYGLACNIAKRKGFENVHVYNTQCTTVVLRILVDAAVKNRDKPVKEVISLLNGLRPKIKLYAALDTLEYLKKGGRLSSTAAVIGGLLKIKPVIILNTKGEVELVSKQLGMQKALRYIEDEVAADKIDKNYPVYYIYTMVDENCRALMEKTGADGGAVKQNICPVIGAHIGPAAAGITYVIK